MASVASIILIVAAIGLVTQALRRREWRTWGYVAVPAFVLFVTFSFISDTLHGVPQENISAEQSSGEDQEDTPTSLGFDEGSSDEGEPPAKAEPVDEEETGPEVPTLAGLTAGTVISTVEEAGLSCDGPETWEAESFESGVQWLCLSAMGDIEYDVFILAEQEMEEVRAIEASVFDYTGEVYDNTLATDLFTEIAASPYESAQSDEAIAWVEANISDESAETTIGDVEFTLSGSGSLESPGFTSWHLDITPA